MITVGVVGVNHKTADLFLREEVIRAAEKLKGEKSLFFSHPTVLLSTCNRIEIYFDGENLSEVHSDLLAFLRLSIKKGFEHCLYSYFGIDCFVHLCRVTAGLDSAIFAETEIQRQVKNAYGSAKFLSSNLHFVFQKSLKISKNIRSRILTDPYPTLYSTLWQLAKWKRKRILLVGFSKINRGLILYLQHRGIEDLTLCTQNPSQIHLHKVRIVGREILQFWQDYELIVSASFSDGYLIQGKAQKKHQIFDLSMPRSIDPNVSSNIYNIEKMNQLTEKKKIFAHEKLSTSFIWENVKRLSEIYQRKKKRSVFRSNG